MNKTVKIILVLSICFVLFIVLYYLNHDVKENNFINKNILSEKKMSKEESKKIGEELLEKAILFYEQVPGETSKGKLIKFKDKKYLEMKPFVNRASELFFENEIDDFIDYYKIKYDDKKYYIEEGKNELVYIYDDVDITVKNIDKKRMKYKVRWEFCEAKNSKELGECEDTTSYSYKNTFIIEKDKKNWKIKEFSLPTKNF